MKQKVHIRISVYFAAFIACAVALDTSGFAVLALLCAAVHEAGHLIALRLLGVRVEEVSFHLFGIHIRVRSGALISYGREAAIAAAGCAVNLLSALAAFCVWRIGLCFGQNSFALPCEALFYMNLLLGGFNLLPVGPLDGGRALESLLCLRLRPDTAARAVTFLSFLVLVPLGVCGFCLVARTGYNISLLAAALYLSVSVLCKKKMFSFTKQSA